MKAFAKSIEALPAWAILLIFLAIMVGFYFAYRAGKKTRPYTGQLMVLTGICLLALLFYILTFGFKVSKLATGATAATMPRVWCIALVPVAALCAYSIFRAKKEDAAFGRWKLVFIVIVAVFLSVFLYQYIGYYLSSALFILLLMLLLEERRPVPLVAVPVCWMLFSYFVFAKFLFISLPKGQLFSWLPI